jgi:hypothetical protein
MATVEPNYDRPHIFEVRIEAFNLMNTNILPSPNTTFNDANFGRIATPRGSIYFPRNVQIGAKLYF